MAQANLLKAVCAAALLAATPAFAQNSPTPGEAAPPPATQGMPEATPGQTGTPSHPGWREHRATSRSQGAMSRQRGSTGPNAQNAEVDRLNQQSYEAAQRGQNFAPGGGGMSTAPSGGGSMNDMGGGAMGGAPPTGGGAMGGGGGGAPSSDGGGKM